MPGKKRNVKLAPNPPSESSETDSDIGVDNVEDGEKSDSSFSEEEAKSEGGGDESESNGDNEEEEVVVEEEEEEEEVEEEEESPKKKKKKGSKSLIRKDAEKYSEKLAKRGVVISKMMT